MATPLIPTVSADTLNSLKPGVLQAALAARPDLKPRKIRAVNKILDKIVYPCVLEAEFAENLPKLENLENQNNEE